MRFSAPWYHHHYWNTDSLSFSSSEVTIVFFPISRINLNLSQFFLGFTLSLLFQILDVYGTWIKWLFCNRNEAKNEKKNFFGLKKKNFGNFSFHNPFGIFFEKIRTNTSILNQWIKCSNKRVNNKTHNTQSNQCIWPYSQEIIYAVK